MLDANLGRTQNMARGMEREGDAVATEALSIAQRLNPRVWAKAFPQNRFSARLGQIEPGTGARVIRMSMGDNGHLHALPRVHVEAACLAIQPLLRVL